MVGQWTKSDKAGRGMAAALALGALVALAGCISDEQAVDMGLATQCEADGTVAKLGDPAGRYVTRTDVEVCKGPRRDSYNETALEIIDCGSLSTLRAGVIRQSADQARRGADYNYSTQVEQARLRLRVGLADLAQTEAALAAAGVPVTRIAGQGAEHCTKLAAGAAQTN
ncbi:hypothetical protein C0V75_10265 [Tabrizicola sp. TH137]|uniref:hypothetical protein n=1 Tax=Tabrizicola sp. TH137 TaxID=2067452 RepID=UPI000C7C0DAD|nr:hypothetical protein [Tabrizicola sp. TH137]PLL12340.1 hypothetical protein C0V75_10265 [Tabrizicola sp. TH137]